MAAPIETADACAWQVFCVQVARVGLVVCVAAAATDAVAPGSSADVAACSRALCGACASELDYQEQLDRCHDPAMRRAPSKCERYHPSRVSMRMCVPLCGAWMKRPLPM